MRPAARTRLAVAVAATALGVSAWAGALAPAVADPGVDPLLPVPTPAAVPPPAPVPAPAVPEAAKSMLGQATQALRVNPLEAMTDLLAASPQPALVGTLPPPPGTAPVADPWTLAQALRPQNFRMPTEDQASPYALAPNAEPSPFARIDAWKGVHALVHGNLGRMPGDQLGQPLPGTAAPPGSNIPPGLEQFYIDPAAVPPPEAAPPPLPNAPAG